MGGRRDELSRVIYGARHSLVVGVASVALGTLLGVALGAAAAGLGGWVDAAIMRLWSTSSSPCPRSSSPSPWPPFSARACCR